MDYRVLSENELVSINCRIRKDKPNETSTTHKFENPEEEKKTPIQFWFESITANLKVNPYQSTTRYTTKNDVCFNY